jgi:hypothetical protein
MMVVVQPVSLTLLGASRASIQGLSGVKAAFSQFALFTYPSTSDAPYLETKILGYKYHIIKTNIEISRSKALFSWTCVLVNAKST